MAERVFTQTFGVAGAIIEKSGKFLLIKETKPSAKGKWSHPAGWIEVGENVLDSVKREVLEETGYDFMPVNLLGIYALIAGEGGHNVHAIKIIFTGKIYEKPVADLADDSSEVKWFSPEEIYAMDEKTLRDVDIKTMVKDYLLGKRYPLELLTHTIAK